MPLGLSSIASVVRRAGHEVCIFDRFAQMARLGPATHLINQAMLQGIREFRPDIIGLNTVSPLIYDAVQCVETIRREYEGVILAGGHHATAVPALTLQKLPRLNGIVQGEGELPLLRLLDGDLPQSIEGLWWRAADGSITNTPARQIADLDSLPFPDLHLLDLSFYTRRSVLPIRGYCLSSISLLTSRGCDKNCSFCTESLTYGKGVRFHSPEYVIEWVKQIARDYRVEGIYFHDNDFLADRARAMRICEGFMANGLHKRLKWAIQARSDRVDREVVGLLKRAGCVVIETGVEAASQKELDAVKKMSTVHANEKAVEICRSMGMSVHAYMLTSFEGETLVDLENRLNWLKKVRPTSFSWQPIQIHPASPLYQRKQLDFFEKNDWTEDRVVTYYRQDYLSSIPAEQRRLWMKKNFSPFAKRYKRLGILRRNPLPKLLLLFFDDLWRFIRKYRNHRTHQPLPARRL